MFAAAAAATGFPDGALGVWVITRLDANGDAVTDPTTTPVFRWKSELVQRIADAHAPGSKIHLNDGTTTYSGVRCLEPRPDGLTMLSGGADGWVHTWEVADGDVVVVGRPKTDGTRARAAREEARGVASKISGVRGGDGRAAQLSVRVSAALVLRGTARASIAGLSPDGHPPTREEEGAE